MYDNKIRFKEEMTWSYVKKSFLDTLVPSFHGDYKISLLSAVTPDSPTEDKKWPYTDDWAPQ